MAFAFLRENTFDVPLKLSAVTHAPVVSCYLVLDLRSGIYLGRAHRPKYWYVFSLKLDTCIIPQMSQSYQLIHGCYHIFVIATSMFEATVGRGALWAALSKTGNARHAPLLLTLDVKGPNDLAAKAEAAIAGGMSQTDLEAVLAVSAPAAPEPLMGRKDHPTLIQSPGKASLTLALAAAQPNQRRQALAALDDDMAKSTKPAHESRLRTFIAICAAWEIQAFPLSPECIRCAGASFKAGCYRSAAVYFQTAVSHQLRVLGLPTSHFLRSMIRDVVRSVKRGLGPSQLKSGFDLAALGRVVDPHDDRAFDMERVPHMADLMIICSWFMLREIEISFSRDGHLTIAECRSTRPTLTEPSQCAVLCVLAG